MYNVVTTVIQEYVAFSKNKLLNIYLLNTNFAKMILNLKRWLRIDFSTLRKPHLNYKSQMQIDPHQVCMANAAMAHFGLDLGRFVQWMGGEYTSQNWDTHSTLAAVRLEAMFQLMIMNTWSGSSLMVAQPSLTSRSPSATRLRWSNVEIQKASTTTPLWPQRQWIRKTNTAIWSPLMRSCVISLHTVATWSIQERVTIYVGMVWPPSNPLT